MKLRYRQRRWEFTTGTLAAVEPYRPPTSKRGDERRYNDANQAQWQVAFVTAESASFLRR